MLMQATTCAQVLYEEYLKGQLPLSFLCLNKGCIRPHAGIVMDMIKLVCEKIGPVAAFKLACVVDRLPKTRSGKILRGTMVCIADSKQFWAPVTIDDPAVLDEVRTAFQAMGYAK